MDADLKFGPFDLLRPVGTGGMGMVWHAVHRQQDHPVAIKVMTGERARQDRFVNAFREEVRAVARLNHPNIIRIFDSGQVDGDAEEITDGQLIAGSPYLAMELADFSLHTIDRDMLNWPRTRVILMHILDALAHSHARGLVHRDLKPDNVLFVVDDDDARITLSDFGLAHAMDASRDALVADEDMVSGTPRYMAPEQATGRVRDQGPWTDLYALGCLIYWLVGGAPPFDSDDIELVLRSHVSEPRPPLKPAIKVPEGFEQWVMRLLTISPARRFRRAADAAAALAQFEGDSGKSEKMTLSASLEGGDAIDLSVVDESGATFILSGALDVGEAVEGADVDPRADTQVESLPSWVPDVPPTWRYAQPPPESIKMVGVGLGLYGLREIPLVGREDERDRLWEALSDARHTGRTHAALLSGPPGIGKTRLARWVAERGHELGAVEVLEASHSPISGPGHGLSRMFANFLGCTGLPREKILQRVRSLYASQSALDENDLHQCMAVTELLSQSADPDFDAEDTKVRFGRPKERYLAWKKLLQRLGKNRPLLVILDDVHWGSDTLQFVNYLLEEGSDEAMPVLLVMTARDEALGEFSLAESLVEVLETKAFFQRLDLGPLSDAHHDELIQNLLGLEPDVAEQVAHRTAGNPLFAIQLVGDWVERGVLQISDEGFRLPKGEEAPLPEDIHHLLVQRLEKLVGQKVDEEATPALLALELASALGRKVDYREWHHVCASTDIAVPPDLLDSMASQSLARLGEHGWTFVHGALRETLERIAIERGRIEDHHRRCVEMLGELYDAERDALAPRLARHLLAAGEDEDALGALLKGMKHYRVTCDFEASEAMFALYEGAQKRLGLGVDDRETVQGWLELAAVHQRQYRLDETDEILEHCEESCRRNGWDLLLAQTLHDRANNARLRSHLEEGLEYARESLDLYRELKDDPGITRALSQLGAVRRWRGELESALPLLKEAERRFEMLGARRDHATCLHEIASVYTGLKKYRRAADFAERAREIFEELGDLKGVSHCFTNLGENYRRRGDLVLAEKYYLRALKTGERIGLSRDLVYSFNLAITLLEQNKFDMALGYMQEALKRAKISERPAYLGLAHAGMAACAAGLENWTGFDAHFAAARRLLEQTSFIDHDLARLGEVAGEHAEAAGQRERAGEAYAFALDQWRAVGDDDRAEAIEEKIAQQPQS